MELVNLSPEGTLNFRLPGLNPVCRVDRTFDGLEAYISTLDPETVDRVRLGEALSGDETVLLNLDTLCLMPDEKTFFLLWRGRTPVYDHTALEIDTVSINLQAPA